MIAKLPYLKLPGRISLGAHLNAYLSSVSGANYIQTNPRTDQNPPNSAEYEAKIQSLKSKLHPETLIHILSSTNDLNSSLRLFKWASLQNRFQNTSDTYYHIIMRLGMASRVDEMEGFCNEMMKAQFPESEQALLRLLDNFITYHRLDEALRVLSVLNSFSYKPSISFVNRLLGALVEEKKGLKSILFVYKEMVKTNILPSIETLNHLLEALFDADRVDAALDQYNRMQKKGCCPNSRTYDIMVSSLIGKNLMDEALLVLNEVLDNVCDLESKFFSHIIPLLFKNNQHKIGLRLFEKMKTSKILSDVSIYETLIHYFSKNLSMDDALNLLQEMINLDLKPSDCVFLDLVNGFCTLNKFNEAKTFLEDNQVTEANPYNVLLKCYCECESGNFLEAIDLFQEMMKKNITNTLSWNIFISHLTKNPTSNTLYKALSRMIVSGSTPDSLTYSALIIAKCNPKEINHALNLFHHVREEHWVIDSSSYATLIENLCKNNKILEAIDVFHYMSLNKCTLNPSSFSILIMRLCQNGKLNKAIDMIPLAYYSGMYCSNSDYNIILKSLSKIPKKNYLLIVFARMVIEGCCLDSEGYNELIKSTIEHNQVTKCGFFLNKMVDEGLWPSMEILEDSVSFLGRNCHLHMVLEMINKLVCEYEVVNPKIYGVLINGLWKEGYKDEGRWLLDVMLEKGWVPDGGTHRLLINSGGSEILVKGDTQDEIGNILSEGFGE
ncbi:pentatricopeptide repeat-containing protein At3g53700, chloroplastic [Lactuca sativa]|uniref:Pentacotripeptide-repeat region of PRORP domain-containing protein n=1 Tax=Lactuca sativa TaxID=4236 RepID=A0A9R1V3Q0_LACSA|nr:pentatricopeptide repeat-containing protein At3g53700, chloroplastic [Lactuca sativa]KAJ0197952.1 hypothetical protein LSAT_V11C700367910 [Lactuca sativa]